MPNFHNKSLVARNVGLSRATTVITYLTPDEVQQIESTALGSPRKGERDALLIRVLFQTGLRISEALSLTPAHLEIFEGRPSVRIVGKGGKPRRVACPTMLAESLQAYAFRHHPVQNASSPLTDSGRTRSSKRLLRRSGCKSGSIPTYSVTQIPLSGCGRPETPRRSKITSGMPVP